ncbi:signal peptidase II [Alphaproteobacteria bacterium]|jgi:signal peptidase II|nr:signal peptidase II [Alphaproteobacteria bacterium]|tara:strand:- start:595 stop:1080 length:486 start_codon:yes stop_codon:yes gene_type:complete
MFGILFNNKFNLTLFFLFLTLVILDQVTKALVINFFNLYDSVALLPMINLTFVVNYGFAFGLLNNPSLNQILVSLVILAIIIYFLYLLIKTQDKIFQLTLTLILAGALGNFIDRIFRGFVIDFIDIYIGKYHWPAFNIADSCITVGFVVLMINILFLNKKL